MDYRTGKCSQCGAEYKIPASFAHNVARCKLCKGVVHLGAAPPGSAPRAPAPPRSEGAPARGSSRPPRRERADTPAEAQPTAPTHAAQPPRERVPERRPSETPASTAHAAARPVTSASQSHAGAGAVRPPRRRVAALWFVAALALAAAGTVFYRSFSGGRDAGAPEREPAGSEARPAPESPAGDAAPGSEGGSDAEEHREKSAPGESTSVPAPAAPAPLVALERIPDFDPTPDTGAEEWTRMVQGTAAWLAADDGEAADRERAQLLAQGRKAVPALVNAFKRQDFSTAVGLRACDRCRGALAEIANGATVGGTGGGDGACRQSAAAWAEAWSKAVQSIDAWIALARLEQEDPAEAHRLREQFGGLGPPEEPLGDE